jgi:apolipoprotein N-acyltransferase
VIDREGRIVGELALGEAGYLDVRVPAPSADPTFYSRMGDMPVGVTLVLVFGALWWLGRRNAIANPRATS